MFVASLTSVTVTPGMTPLASRTAPRTPPVNCCPNTGAPTAKTATDQSRIQTRLLSMISLRKLLKRTGEVAEARILCATLTGESTIRAIFLAAACLLCAGGAPAAAQNPAAAEELVKRG